jgi:hypothetical protein
LQQYRQSLILFCLASPSQYHGHVLGFENLYILDGSTDTRCVSFLRYARDILGANVVFTDANLNEIEAVMSKIATDIAGSSDLIMKVDTDEFLVVHNNITKTLSTSISEYLSGYSKDANHPLHLHGDSRVGYVQESVPSEEVCDQDIYSTLEKFPLGPVISMADDRYKAVFVSRKGRMKINLGGHIFEKTNGWTEFAMIHYHWRCFEIEVENCKRVLERHEYISPSDTDTEAKAKLVKKLGCPADNMCNCDQGKEKSFASGHKAFFYARWLDCPETCKTEYYRRDISNLEQNMELNNAMQKSYERFDL